MSNVDTELDPQEMADRAWNRARSFEFRGKPLQVWDFLRKTAAEAMGLKWGDVPEKDFVTVRVPDPKTKTVQTIRVSYRGINTDAAIVLWLLHQDGAAARAAINNPEAARDAMAAWAEEQNLLSNSLDFDEEGMKLFKELMSDVQASTSVPKVEGSQSSGAKKKPIRKRRSG